MDGHLYFKKNTSRIKQFNHDDKKKLIKAVRENYCIWDLTQAKHVDANSIAAAWESVALKVNKSEEDCKRAWTSLKESLKYRRAKAEKSGVVTDSIDWQYGELMAFVPNLSTAKRTINMGILEGPSRSSSSFSTAPPSVISEYILDEEPPSATFESDVVVTSDSEISLPPTPTYDNPPRQAKKRKVETVMSPEETVMSPEEQIVDILLSHFENSKKAKEEKAERQREEERKKERKEDRPVFSYWATLFAQLSQQQSIEAEREMSDILYKKIVENNKKSGK